MSLDAANSTSDAAGGKDASLVTSIAYRGKQEAAAAPPQFYVSSIVD